MDKIIIASVLAGGNSQRMGQDKANLRLDDETMLERTVRVAANAGLSVQVIGRSRPPDWKGFSADFFPDLFPGEGPLPAIAASLIHAGRPVFILPCDAPQLNIEALGWIIAQYAHADSPHGLILTRSKKIEPLFSIYNIEYTSVLNTAIARGERSCQKAIGLGIFSFAEIPDEFASAFNDCDTPQEWKKVFEDD